MRCWPFHLWKGTEKSISFDRLYPPGGKMKRFLISNKNLRGMHLDCIYSQKALKIAIICFRQRCRTIFEELNWTTCPTVKHPNTTKHIFPSPFACYWIWAVFLFILIWDEIKEFIYVFEPNKKWYDIKMHKYVKIPVLIFIFVTNMIRFQLIG